MGQNERSEFISSQLIEWEKKLNSYEPNDLLVTADKYIERAFLRLPLDVQQSIFNMLDAWFFQLHAFIQGSQLQTDAKERILAAGRVFDPQIESVQDMRRLTYQQLQYIADQQISRHRVYSLFQGALAGTGQAALLGSDIPAITVINLRVVQLLAFVYGYEVNNPLEMMSSLKIFHAATLPARMHASVWDELKQEWKTRQDDFFYEGREELTDTTWLEQPLKQLAKALAIVLFRNKTFQGIPLVSMAIGASSNYHLTRKVTEFALHYYQFRYVLEKESQE